MLSFIKSSFLWQFVAGFALGAAGLAVLHPGAAQAGAAPTHVATR